MTKGRGKRYYYFCAQQKEAGRSDAHGVHHHCDVVPLSIPHRKDALNFGEDNIYQREHF